MQKLRQVISLYSAPSELAHIRISRRTTFRKGAARLLDLQLCISCHSLYPATHSVSALHFLHASQNWVVAAHYTTLWRLQLKATQNGSTPVIKRLVQCATGLEQNRSEGGLMASLHWAYGPTLGLAVSYIPPWPPKCQPYVFPRMLLPNMQYCSEALGLKYLTHRNRTWVHRSTPKPFISSMC